MDLPQIRYFLALADTLNFTRAAEICHVTQPALTRSVQKLEEELGGKLLLRERGNSQLTELGQAMLPLLRRTYDAAVAARQEAAQFHRQEAVRLRLGIDPWVPPGTLHPLLAALAPRFPTLELSVRQGDTAQLNAWLLAAEVDVAITVDDAGLTDRANAWALFDDDMVVVVPPGHGLAGTGPIPAQELDGHDLVGQAGTGLAATLAAALAPNGFRHSVSSQEQLWAVVQAGLGVAFSTGRGSSPEGLMRRALDPPRRHQVWIASMPGRPASRAADALVKLARARGWVREGQAEPMPPASRGGPRSPRPVPPAS